MSSRRRQHVLLPFDLKGELYDFKGQSYPARPELVEHAKRFLALAVIWWAKGKWKPHPANVKEGGLLGVLQGMRMMKQGKVPSGERWVYGVEETEWPIPRTC
jgi:hypothetical protein